MTENPWRPWTKAQGEMLRAANAPLVNAVQEHRAAAESLAALAEQLTGLAEQVARTARRQAELTAALQAAMKPYQDYLDWLDGGA